MKFAHVIDLLGAQTGKERLATSDLPYSNPASGKIEFSKNSTFEDSSKRVIAPIELWFSFATKSRSL